MKKSILTYLFATISFMICLTGCSQKDHDNLQLYLKMDEKSGNTCFDSAQKQEPAKVFYNLSNGTYQDPIEPQWRENGINDGTLQFDGYSSFIRYDYDSIAVGGSSLTLDAWLAPRSYEWLDPNDNKLTAIISQHSKSDNQGFIVGMSRYGSWSFQVGLGDRWIEIWDEGHPLEKYEWSHITAVFDGDKGEIKLYKNGELINTKLCYEGAKIDKALETPLFIGKNNESDTIGPFSKEMFSGLMDEVRIYNSALNEKDIKKLQKVGTVKGEIKQVVFDDLWFDDTLLVNDKYKPTYHISAAQHWMNEPHAPMYYNGSYHLFYQFNPFGPYWQQIHWGHWVSDDLVNWKNVKEALSPTKDSVAPDGIWSGGATYKNDGTPVLLFTAGDDSRSLNPISNQNVGLALPLDTSDPNLIDWVMSDKLAVKQEVGQGRAGEFRDSHIWKEDGIWYMIVCSGSMKYSSGDVLCYTTTDDSFTDWEYRGSIYEWNAPLSIFGTSWELPILLPMKYENGQESGKYFFSISPAPAGKADNEVFYWIGEFDKQTCRFTPDFEQPKLIDYGNNVFTGPSAFIDPNTGFITIFSIIQDQRSGNEQYNSGWAHGAGLTRILCLDESNNLLVKVTSNISNNIGKTLFSGKDLSVSEANEKLASIQSDSLRITMKIKENSSKKYGIYVNQSADKRERTQIYYDSENSKLGINTGLSSIEQSKKGNFNGDFVPPNGILSIELYLDRSIIEGFFNNRNTITARVYPTLLDSKGIELFSEGGDIEILEITIQKMESIYAR